MTEKQNGSNGDAPRASWIQRLGKWRTLLAGWQLGTRPDTDPECQAVRDHRDATLALRAEVTALTALLVDKGVFTAEEFGAQVEREAQYYCRLYEQRFPGVTATDCGLTIDRRAAAWMKGWRP